MVVVFGSWCSGRHVFFELPRFQSVVAGAILGWIWENTRKHAIWRCKQQRGAGRECNSSHQKCVWKKSATRERSLGGGACQHTRSTVEGTRIATCFGFWPISREPDRFMSPNFDLCTVYEPQIWYLEAQACSSYRILMTAFWTCKWVHWTHVARLRVKVLFLKIRFCSLRLKITKAEKKLALLASLEA